MPDDVFSVSYSVTTNDGIALTCISKDKNSAAYFLHGLKQTALFSDIKLSNLAGKTDEKGNQLESMFTVTFKMKK